MLNNSFREPTQLNWKETKGNYWKLKEFPAIAFEHCQYHENPGGPADTGKFSGR
jgi:hypothetical protein